jgi:hypothetical protein
MLESLSPSAESSVRTGKKNVIILTSGITGSSVLAGFLVQSGYWVGESTHKKEYNTFENQDLINLNLQIFQQAGYTANYTLESSPDVLVKIDSIYGKVEGTPYRQFIESCNPHRPWIWKDPRLWITFRFWRHFLDLDDCKFILLTRDLTQAWLSVILRRQIMGYKAFKKQEEHVKNSIVSVLNGSQLPYVHITYDDLIAKPEETIQKLNAFLESDLIVDDLKAIYHKPLHRAPRASVGNSMKAVLIYLKNYSERAELTMKKT